MNTTMSQATEEKPHDKYVKRLRARLARPQISVHEARDAMLDCFVSTYHEGVQAGLKGILGIDAKPDAVALAAAGMFRTRLSNHGATFERPTVDALAKVKEEVDRELHFNELPAEIAATHDQVCSLLMSKAEGHLDHSGDRSAVRGSTRSTERGPGANTAAPDNASAPSSATPSSSVSRNLRQALADYLSEVSAAVLSGEPAPAVETRLDRARRLLGSVAEFEG